MKICYISPTLNEHNGISKYSEVFLYYLANLKAIELKHIQINSIPNKDNEFIMHTDNWSTYDIIHIEIGYGTYGTYMFLLNLLDKNIYNISITIHDPLELVSSPSLPDFKFNTSSLLLKLGRRLIFDHIKRRANRYKLLKLKNIFVLNKGVVKLVKDKYKVNTHYLPLLAYDWENDTSIYEKNRKYSFVFYGFVAPAKGIEILLKAFKEIEAEDKVLYLVGGTLNEKYLSELKKLCFKLNITDQVIFTGYVNEKELAVFLANAFVAIFPYLETKSYGASAAISELSKYSIPIIASNIKRFRMEYNDNELLYFEEGSVKDLKEKMQLIVYDEELYKKMSNGSKNRYKKTNPNLVIEKFLNVLEQKNENSN